MRLILASQSIYRRQLLEDAGFEVRCHSADVDESILQAFPDLEEGLAHLAQSKARHIGRRGIQGLILGADTVGVAAGRVLGKPVDRASARGMLDAISGTVHTVLTGWCLFRTRDQLAISGVETTTIHMRAWRPEELDAYLDSGEWQGKCGAYGLRLEGDPFVTHMEGSASNVIGLPMERLKAVLDEFGCLSTGS